jgi:hypothetical protein
MTVDEMNKIAEDLRKVQEAYKRALNEYAGEAIESIDANRPDPFDGPEWNGWELHNECSSVIRDGMQVTEDAWIYFNDMADNNCAIPCVDLNHALVLANCLSLCVDWNDDEDDCQ